MCLVFFRIMSVFVIVVFVLGLVVVVLFRVRFYWLLMRLMYSILADEFGGEEAAARKRRRGSGGEMSVRVGRGGTNVDR